MCRKICVTNRSLAVRDFTEQVKRVLDTRPYALILREKDLCGADYAILARDMAELCKKLIAEEGGTAYEYDIPEELLNEIEE